MKTKKTEAAKPNKHLYDQYDDSKGGLDNQVEQMPNPHGHRSAYAYVPEPEPNYFKREQ